MGFVPTGPGNSGGLLLTSILTSGTSYTVSSATTRIEVEVWGGGGAGGGVTGAAANRAAQGGGGGGYAFKRFTVTPSQALAYAIGAGGTGVVNAAGNPGGNTTFTVGAVVLTGTGGNGGNLCNSAAFSAAVVPVAGANGDLNGTSPAPDSNGTGATTVSGTGADMPPLGAGGQARTTSGAGNNAAGFAAGGGGGLDLATSTNRAGGNGAPGVIVVREYGSGNPA